jgi:hypothetical protein
MINLNKKGITRQAKFYSMILVMAAAIVLVVAGCLQTKRVIYTPHGYDITQPIRYDLGSKLDEISGICWINDSLIIANNDESGKIFYINPREMGDLEYRNLKFGEKNDYEDIVKVDSAIYILQSTGRILKVTNFTDESSIQSKEVAVLAGLENEFESLYYDKDVNSLVLLCKDCHKEKDKIRSAYRFDLATNTLIDTPYYQFSMDALRKKMDDHEAEFRPSAAAINPADNKLYMISSIGKTLVVADHKGKIEQAMKISGLMFPQPEGITFAGNGDMYISNEIGTEEAATLLKFKYTKPKK